MTEILNKVMKESYEPQSQSDYCNQMNEGLIKGSISKETFNMERIFEDARQILESEVVKVNYSNTRSYSSQLSCDRSTGFKRSTRLYKALKGKLQRRTINGKSVNDNKSNLSKDSVSSILNINCIRINNLAVFIDRCYNNNTVS